MTSLKIIIIADHRLVGIKQMYQSYIAFSAAHNFIPAIFAIAYDSFVTSRAPVNKYSSFNGCGESLDIYNYFQEIIIS